MSDLTITLNTKSVVPERSANTAQLRAMLPPSATGTPLAVTLPQCEIDLNSLDFDKPGANWIFQGGEITLTLVQTIHLDARLSPCDKTWILKHEKKHVKENEKVYRKDLKAKLNADSAFKTLTSATTLSTTDDRHMQKIADRVIAVFGKLMDDARARIDTKSEYEDVEGKKKKYCGTGSSTTPTFSVLRKGHVGSDVNFAQRLLNAGVTVGLLKGPRLEVDGIFGGGTKTRVKDFQKKVFITSDGVIGPITWAMLMILSPFSA